VFIFDPLHKYPLNMKHVYNSMEPKSTYVYQNMFENFEMWDKFSNGLLKNKIINILKSGRKQDISNWYLANQKDNKNLKM
jgi:hypothetical protein